jgi:hypothetical protein
VRVVADGPEQNAGDDPHKDEPDDPAGGGDPRQPGGGDAGGDRGGFPGSASGQEQPGDRAEGKAAPGRGALPPVPDQADAPPLSRPDAAVHLERASRRIHDDLVAHRRGRARPAAPGVRDW